MGYEKTGLIIVAIIIGLASAAYAATGPAVFYDPPYTPSACYGKVDKGAMVAGVSDQLWANGAACGKSYRVKCIKPANAAEKTCKYGKTIVVKVVDYCRQGCEGVINLSRDAFSKIAYPDAGKVIVQYDQA